MSTTPSPTVPLLPDPQRDAYRIVVGDLIPNGFVRLVIGHLAEGAAIAPRQNPPLDRASKQGRYQRGIETSTKGHSWNTT
jgi:hypothetical protein